MSGDRAQRNPAGAARTLADVDEGGLLAELFPRLAAGPDVLVGPGDDAALLGVRTASVLATTDAMIRDRDWRDDWSGPDDVGHKIVVQNVADIAAMGGWCTALLVTLVADPATTVQWVQEFTDGLIAEAEAVGTSVIGGDLSSAPQGVLMVSITALGEVADAAPVLRSGARPGDLVAVCGTLGRAAAGLMLLQRDSASEAPELVAAQRRPSTPYRQGPVAARAGATALIDVSDGLLRDADRIARSSGVAIDLETEPLAADVAALDVLDRTSAWDCVLGGGEEHSLLGTFPGRLPPGWRRIGAVREGSGVSLDGRPATVRGWDHFGPQGS